jgi:DNA-binding MarR family transcriptional regulator
MKMRTEKQAEVIWSYMNRRLGVIATLGLTKELTIVQDVALCILATPGIIKEDIIRHVYFHNVSRSTIKRAVNFLFTNGYIKTTKGLMDARKNHLYFKRVD